MIDGGLVTPPLSCGALPGITRAVVFELADRLAYPAPRARPSSSTSCAGAGEAFLTSSLRGIAPLVRVGSRVVGPGVPGDLTRTLIDRHAALIAG